METEAGSGSRLVQAPRGVPKRLWVIEGLHFYQGFRTIQGEGYESSPMVIGLERTPFALEETAQGTLKEQEAYSVEDVQTSVQIIRTTASEPD